MTLLSRLDDKKYQFKIIEENNEKYENELLMFNLISQTFNIKFEKKLSTRAKQVLQTWRNKSFYCANEDLLYVFKFNLSERDFLLQVLHSMAIFLQNATCSSFFDISIYNVIITEQSNFDKLNKQKVKNIRLFDSLTFTLHCHVAAPPEKQDIPW